MTAPPRLFACAWLLLVTGCASTFQSPASGGSVWHEAASAHFVVRTNAGVDEARSWVLEYERIYSYFAQVAFPSTEKPSGVTDVVIFEDEADFREIAPRLSGGFFRRHGGAVLFDPRPTIVGYEGYDDQELRRTFQHELAHRFIAFHFPNAPVWLNEGLATFHEATRFEGEKVVFGEVPHSMRYSAEHGWYTWGHEGLYPLTGLPSAGSVRALTPEDFYANKVQDELLASSRRNQNYLAAWALTHVLTLGSNERRSRFLGYQNALAAGEVDAWDRNFDAAAEASLDAAYRAFLGRHETIRVLSNLPADRSVSVTSRAMSPAEVHWLWAVTRPWDSKSARLRARDDIETSIRLEPQRASGHVLRAAWWAAQGSRDSANRDIERALALEPENRNALTLRAVLALDAETRKPENDRTWRETVAPFAQLKAYARSAYEFLLIAIHEGARGRLEQAVPYALRAVRTDSSCWECYWIAAELEFARGNSEVAIRAMRLSLSLGSEEGARKLVPRLRELENAAEECKKGASACRPRPFPVTVKAIREP